MDATLFNTILSPTFPTAICPRKDRSVVSVSQTIFEINASAKKKSVAVMRTKRLAHDGVIQKVRENSSSGEHGAASPLVSSAHVSASDVVRDSSQVNNIS